MIIRKLERSEIGLIWTIDRSEVIDHIYYLRGGELVLEAEHYDVAGWPPGEAEQYTPLLLDCYSRGGVFWGSFEGPQMVGAAVLESKFIGRTRDQLQLKLLHVSRSHRKTGLGRELFTRAANLARALGARRLYISATPSLNTIGFYRRLGCVVTEETDPDLYELEPEDIHLEYAIPNLVES